MTENDEKVAEEYAGKKCGTTNKFSPICSGCAIIKLAYLDGIAHERARNKAKRLEEQTVEKRLLKGKKV